MLKKNKIGTGFFRFAALAVALLFLCVGVLKEEYLEVMQKAVRICLECIGIG